MTASISISMRHAGLSSAATTTMVAAGRIVPKNSPCTRPTASQSSTWVRYMRVRTTSSKRGAGFGQGFSGNREDAAGLARGILVVGADGAGSGEVDGSCRRARRGRSR